MRMLFNSCRENKLLRRCVSTENPTFNYQVWFINKHLIFVSFSIKSGFTTTIFSMEKLSKMKHNIDIYALVLFSLDSSKEHKKCL